MVTVIISAFAGALGVTQASVSAGINKKLLPIYSVETDEKKIALTFDTAWGDNDTDELINILKKYNAEATFFCVGDFVRKYPDAVKAFYESGHEIGNHSDTHKLYSKSSAEVVRAELQNCNEEIKKITGTEPVVCRPPSGDYDNKSIEIAESMGMKTIQWDCDSRDWKNLSVEEMYQSITKNAKNGSIILFHNGIKNTPKTLDKVLAFFSNQGYEFVTVSNLIYKEDYEIDFSGRQRLN